MFVWCPEGNLQTALVGRCTVSCSNFVFPRNLNCCMQWCRFDGERKGCKQEKDKTSGVVAVQGQILSDGIGHVQCIVRTYMHTKALLNVFITLSHEMKILIFSATCFLSLLETLRCTRFNLPSSCCTPPHCLHDTPANSLNGNTLIMMAETYIPTPSIC